MFLGSTSLLTPRPSPAGTPGRGSRRAGRRTGAGGLAALVALGTIPAITLGTAANAAVTVGENITAFPDRDMVVAVGYTVGETLLVEVVRNGVVIGSTEGPAADTPEGVGLEINHGPAGAPAPGDCWNGFTPDIVGGDIIRLTSSGGVDTMTVADVKLYGEPALDANNNVFVTGTGTASGVAVEFRRDKPDPRFRRGPFPTTADGAGGWTATFRPSTTTSAEGLTPDQQRTIALTTASWAAVVDDITETTISELGEPGGVAAGCTGSADPNSIAGGLAPINIASGDVTFSGTTRVGVAAVSVTAGSLPTKNAVLTANPDGSSTWTALFPKTELGGLPDGSVTVTASFDGTPASRTVLKDMIAPAAPTPSPAPGTYATTQSVTLNKPAGELTSDLFWAIGPSPIAEPSTPYTGQISVSATQTISARLVDRAGNPGAVGTFRYTIGAPPANAAPSVVNTSPASGATGVPVGDNITATFSEAVQGVGNGTFTLRNASTGAAVTGAASYDSISRVATLKPGANLTNSTSYTATLTGGTTAIRDASNLPLSTTSWTFTTAAGTSTGNPAPTITQLSPADGATGASQINNITMRFSEAVQGVTSGTVVLTNAATGAQVASAVTYNSSTFGVVLNPNSTLAAGTPHTVTVTGGSAGVRDLAGAPLVTRSWTFTTAGSSTTNAAPTVTGRSPGINATGATVSGNITATFSEAVQGVTGSTFTLRNASTGVAVSGVVTYSTTSRTATLNPGANLAASTRYTATLTGGTAAIRDSANLGLATTSWSFTTGTSTTPPTNVAPTVAPLSPGSGATGASRVNNVTMRFSEAVTGVSGSTVVLKNASTGATIASVVSYNSSTLGAVLNPNNPLAANTRYTVTVTGGTTAIRDSAAMALVTRSWSFTTGAS